MLPRWRARGELAGRLQDIDALYDLYATTSEEMREAAQLAGLARVVTLRWAASLGPLAPRRLPVVDAAHPMARRDLLEERRSSWEAALAALAAWLPRFRSHADGG